MQDPAPNEVQGKAHHNCKIRSNCAKPPRLAETHCYATQMGATLWCVILCVQGSENHQWDCCCPSTVAQPHRRQRLQRQRARLHPQAHSWWPSTPAKCLDCLVHHHSLPKYREVFGSMQKWQQQNSNGMVQKSWHAWQSDSWKDKQVSPKDLKCIQMSGKKEEPAGQHKQENPDKDSEAPV